ncbi:MAG: response regulator [Proteobacteria bacterium]|nr:response regulator [Pseudomonadota bacterium]MBU1716609.1 response regulator [Pseudomonadota bacterium]
MVDSEKKKILIIEPSTFFEKVLESNLSTDQFIIATEKDIGRALLKVVRWHPDLVITGIEVGTISGFDLCLLLKMMPDFAGLPIILISSYDDQLIHQKAADAGADYYVIKNNEAVENIKAVLANLFFPEKQAAKSPKSKEIESILLVDDSLTMRKVIRNILLGVGIQKVIEAKNGQDGLDQLAAHQVDMVISDWAMPLMNGVEMIKNIRLNPNYQNLPIIMVSAEVQEEIEKAMHCGINGYLRKPFNALDMKQLIAKFSTPAAE